MNKKKLIEVALPLEAINTASAREKSMRHGHPSTLHLWWARRPLAAARAVIFAQMVDDPSAHPDLFPTKKKQEKERDRLFRIIENLVQWENTTNETVLRQARDAIWQSWRATCAENAGDPRAADLFNSEKLPGFHDPFAGGGALPLEAQRLGLESYAADLNPVAALICKAMIEIPPKFAKRRPVNPTARSEKTLLTREWGGAQGLAEDVRYYGEWMRNEAQRRIGHLYSEVEVTTDMAKIRPDLRPLVGKKFTAIAWIWARTVRSPNPAFAHVEVPLASTFLLSTKPGKEAYVEPLIDGGSYRFNVKVGKPKDEKAAKNGTKSGGSHSPFLCLMSGTPMPFEYIRAEGKAGRMGARLMALVVEGDRGRLYLPPTEAIEDLAGQAVPTWKPDAPLHGKCRVNVSLYGLDDFGDLFTPRQLVALTTLSDLVEEARESVRSDAVSAGMPDDGVPLDRGGVGATAYGDCLAVYLSFLVSQVANHSSSACGWNSANTQMRSVFARQAIPMVWDYAESNPFSDSSGSYNNLFERQVKGFAALGDGIPGVAAQADACTQATSTSKIVSTDPPYYDNIAYADLSDFFYVWLRRSLKPVFPDLFATVGVPKTGELVATPYLHGSKENAEAFFLAGMTQAMHRLAEQAHPAFPVTIYYAFKQSETDGEEGTASTGWDTFLDAVIRAGFAITGTWPLRTEKQGRVIGNDANALASSIVLVCRARAAEAPIATRREFLGTLKVELPVALAQLQGGNIAPVDLAQAAIGPGMAVYTRYAKVVDAAGQPLSVRDALGLINQTLDEALAEQEGDFDAESRWSLAWFGDHGFADGPFGDAQGYFIRFVTAENALVSAGIIKSGGGKVRLLRPSELAGDWDPENDRRVTSWEMVHQLIRSLEGGGEAAAAELVSKLGTKVEVARELAYRLYTLCERKKRAAEALSYNGLVQSWPEITRLARERGRPRTEQTGLFDRQEGK